LSIVYKTAITSCVCSA